MLRKVDQWLKKSQRGAFMVFFAILVPLFLGMIGFAVDAGFIYMQKAKMQDIADSAALAGAARLNDGEDKEGHVTSAVRAYAEANGLSGVATAMASLDESSDLPTKYDKLKILQGIQYNVTDKDGKQRDHVKVVIAKRVPTFFINILFPDQKDGVVVKVAAAAEYVEGEEPVISGGDPVIMCNQFDQFYDSAENVGLGKNFPFSIYGYACSPNPYKLPGQGTLYSSNLSGGATWKCDTEKKTVIFTPPLPNGREFIPSNGWTTYDTYWTKEEADQQKALAAEMKKTYDAIQEKYRLAANAEAEKIQDYINAVGNKRYIGWDSSKNKPVSNIRSTDTEIELYMSGTYFDQPAEEQSAQFASARSVLTNRQLLNVKKVTSLISNKVCMIGTTGITYGNIYCSTGDGDGLVLAGSRNNFNGTIYAPGNLYIGGESNHFLGDSSGSAEVSIVGNHVYVGKWLPIVESIVTAHSRNFETGEWKTDKCIKIDFNNNQFITAEGRSDWHIYFGYNTSSSGGSSGSDDSGDDTKAHVRLVE